MDMKLEVVPVPVRDVDAAKDFYTKQAGFGLDHDVRPSENMRIVQMTPPGSACSVVIGEGLPLGEPGSGRAVQLVAEDLDAVRGELAGRGVGISEVQQMGPEGTPGSRYCFFEDPDGNMWAIQEYKRTWTPTDFEDTYIMPLAPLSCQFRARTRMVTDTLALSVSAYGCSTLRYTRRLPASHARGSSTRAGG
jgi:catechol 2,3-dioxygenase-like lactoylglutathione lyase family enzyme